jgi:hypothetical protein
MAVMFKKTITINKKKHWPSELLKMCISIIHCTQGRSEKQYFDDFLIEI